MLMGALRPMFTTGGIMYVSGVPKKQGLYWVKENLGLKGYSEPKLCRLEERFNPGEMKGTLVWTPIENNKKDHFFFATGDNHLYWDEQVLPPKEYECLRRIDEVNEKQEDIE
jgi:hypothetical protein